MLVLLYYCAAPYNSLHGEKMYVTDDRIIALLKPLIPKDRLDSAVVYLDTQLRAEGERVSIGRKELPMSFAGYFVFVDLMPIANWGHPAMAVFISKEGDNILSVNVEFPPFFGNPPETFRKLLL